MPLHRFLPAAFLAALFALPVGAFGQLNFSNKALLEGPVVSTDQVRAELMAWAPEGVQAGQPVWVGLQLAHSPDWHTYWKNSGDSGLPTVLEWTLPEGISAGPIDWPIPKKIPIGTLANYGYEGTVLLPVPLTVAPGFQGKQLDIKLRASWLVCRIECIPQEGDFSLTIPAKSSTGLNSATFAAAFAARPKALPPGTSQIQVLDQAIQVSLSGLPASLLGKTLAFFPETSAIIQPAGPWQQAWQGDRWTATVPLSSERRVNPSTMAVVVALDQQEAYRIEAPVSGDWPSIARVAEVSPALAAALKANAALGAPPTGNTPAQLTFFLALLGALVGGMILNLMPCVFPVLAIKVVGFSLASNQASRVRGGLAYSAGVVLSFLALGALLLGLRAGGEQLGWGFQLQNPVVVAGLAALFTLIGLNLAGLFEFGRFLPARVTDLQSQNPTINSFLTGVLATAIASPCTAPFMGAALGYAVGLPAVQALAVFGAIGIGMALPYLAASAVPAFARWLPRPGAWMVTFKQLMAFPMFATVVWLVWVLGKQSGIDGASSLLGLLVLMGLVVWSATLKGKTRLVATSLSLLLGASALWAVGQNITTTVVHTSAVSAAAGRWQAWEPGRVEQLTAQGRSVFVDFTAAWCVTCQYNKKTVLSDESLLADIDAKNVALLRADWTLRDPAVTEALAQLGRNGVPVYVIYKPGQAPVLLSEILTVADMRAELAKL
jgi:thiol:disulfide interchange protein